MGKGRPRAVEKVIPGQNSSVVYSNSVNIPSGPVFYPTEDEFKDPLEFIYKIRPEAEPYGICRIVPPKSWKPPFALDLDSFTFPTKTQAIHQLQVRSAACDPKTFELEYSRFLDEYCGRNAKKVVFEGEDLDLCRLFNAVKRHGGYDKVVDGKNWGEIYKFVRSAGKISACAKHVLCQLYREHLYDYENYYSKLNQEDKANTCKKEAPCEVKNEMNVEFSSSKKRRKNGRAQKSKPGVEDDLDQICEQCKSGLHGDVMLLCDRCNKGWHIYCLSPPLKKIPSGNWYCLECLNCEKDSFGFVPGKQFSLEAFRRVADRAKRRWFGSGSTQREQLEKKFWEIVEGSAGMVEVMYGSDIDTSIYGSGFPRANDKKPESFDLDVWKEYSDSPWNLNNLPKLQGSVLRAVHHSIAGVMVPWLYIGMLFSSFCWHFEDHCFYSMNYLHWGEPKCWYSVPGSEACAFEKVMRDSLPDLFDLQPDLLFQLVTMLNPSVLQQNNVPVYSVLQEPGNFVITFPRSYHGGFNFGLNCAEAVNFAPADWLPHGGFGAGLYQLYRKPAVLSHEELLCVVAESYFDGKVSQYLKKELVRVYEKEKSWRERLWKNGIITSSTMPPHKQPKYVGVEEDPACIICHQFLYLSAVTCRCRPSAFVCLEHWEHICECKPDHRCVMYRHTLSQLKDLVIMAETQNHSDESYSRNSQKQLTVSSQADSLSSRKIKGISGTLAQLAEDWLLNSCKIFQMPYSSDVYVAALKKAEQFLWAGSEMDPVREMTKKLSEAQNWAEGVKDCVTKLELRTSKKRDKIEKVEMKHINNLLSFNPIPCNERMHIKLKGYQKEAELLTDEVNSALSTSSKLSLTDWEILHAKASNSAIRIEGSDDLLQRLNFAKNWIKTARKCILEKSTAKVEVDTLYKLASEISDLHIQFPEVELLISFVTKVDLCRSQCCQMLEGPITPKALDELLQKYVDFSVNVPELRVLRQYKNDYMSWISRFNAVVESANACENQELIVNELTSIKKDGSLLKIQVDELSLLEVELTKASCKVKALKGHGCKMPIDFIGQVLSDAKRLKIEDENLYKELSQKFCIARIWEERAEDLLSNGDQLNKFEDMIRYSEDIFAILPSLEDLTEAVSSAKSWLNESRPFLVSDSPVEPFSNSLLKVDDLKDLVKRSKLLKIHMEERCTLEKVLYDCMKWENIACHELIKVEVLLNSVEISDNVICEIERQIGEVKSDPKGGLALHFDFLVLPKLVDACSTLRWCFKVLSLRAVSPTLEEVDMLSEVYNQLPRSYASSALTSSLIVGVNWLKKALEIDLPCERRLFKLSEAQDVLEQYKAIRISFPVIVDRLQESIKRHNSWVKQVEQFFSLKSYDRSRSLLWELQELGSTDAFNCSELDKIFFEARKVMLWKKQFSSICGAGDGDETELLNSLDKIKSNLDKSLDLYKKLKQSKQISVCICCYSGINQELSTCSVCQGCYHLQCIGPIKDNSNGTRIHICPCCSLMDSGKNFRNKFMGKHPQLNNFVKLLSDADNLCISIKDTYIADTITAKAIESESCLMEVVDFALAFSDKNIDVVTRKLYIALKAVEVGGVYDHDSNYKLEQALLRYSWRFRIRKLLQSSQKTSIQQIDRHLKEGVAIGIPLEDHFRVKLMDLRTDGLQWADRAKKVSTDSGELDLDSVFDLIAEGENLAVHFDKEPKLLKDRSMLYCICRKPYDDRAMIACDKCDEWYHFDCINLGAPPKIYICPACNFDDFTSCPSTTQERLSGKCGEPQTPSPCRTKKVVKKKKKCSKRKVLEEADEVAMGCLFWRNQKPFRRRVRKRVELEILSPFYYVQ